MCSYRVYPLVIEKLIARLYGQEVVDLGFDGTCFSIISSISIYL